jgi:hypothetical protein
VNLSNDTLWLLLQTVLVLVPSSAFLLLFRYITAHSVYLYGRRTDRTSKNVRYQFAIQNNEGASLFDVDTLKVIIQILDRGGTFVTRPKVFLGCTYFKADFDHSDATGRTWIMTFPTLPAYDTWKIDCEMNGIAQNVQLRIEGGDTALTHSTMLLSADRTSKLVGRGKTPEWWWAAVATALAMVGFAAVPLFNKSSPQGNDWLYLTAIGIFGISLFFCRARSAPPITQGYLERSIPDNEVPPEPSRERPEDDEPKARGATV